MTGGSPTRKCKSEASFSTSIRKRSSIGTIAEQTPQQSQPKCHRVASALGRRKRIGSRPLFTYTLRPTEIVPALARRHAGYLRRRNVTLVDGHSNHLLHLGIVS